MRIEKGYGSWNTEFVQNVTPAMCGLDHHVAPNKGDFVGRDAFMAAAGDTPPLWFEYAGARVKIASIIAAVVPGKFGFDPKPHE